jgi:hypothetical protein
MSEDEAYEKLQQLLMIAEDLKASGHYTLADVKDELDLRWG